MPKSKPNTAEISAEKTTKTAGENTPPDLTSVNSTTENSANSAIEKITEFANSSTVKVKSFANSASHQIAKSFVKYAIITCFIAVLLLLTSVNIAFPIRFKSIVEQNSRAFSVDKRLVYAVIWTESKFDKNAVSRAGATGLMQLMPTTASWCADELGEEYYYDRLFDPEFNIKVGTFYLSYLIAKFGEDGAVAAYNAGEGNYQSWQGKIKFSETKTYIKRVSTAKKIYSLKT